MAVKEVASQIGEVVECFNVLIVEDDADDFYILKQSLQGIEGLQATIRHSKTLKTALEVLTERHFDVVLLDLNVPDSTGLGTVRSIMKVCTHIPVIVLTGIDDEKIGKDAIKYGAEDYVPKVDLNHINLERTIKHSIERHRLLLAVKRKAEEDPLTHLLNRSALYTKLDTLIEQADRTDTTIALAMIDLDDFKIINDTHGHSAGDELLVQVSHRLSQNLRKSDAAARFGGDEFLLLLTNYKSREELFEIIKRKQARLMAPYTIETDNGKIEVCVGASIGVAEWRRSLLAGQLLADADEAMYHSKRHGKCMVTFA